MNKMPLVSHSLFYTTSANAGDPEHNLQPALVGNSND